MDTNIRIKDHEFFIWVTQDIINTSRIDLSPQANPIVADWDYNKHIIRRSRKISLDTSCKKKYLVSKVKILRKIKGCL